MTPRLYIFDADGTLRWTKIPGQWCPYAPGEWDLLPGVAEQLRAIPWALPAPRLAVASNQNVVALGHLTREMARRLIEDALVAAIGTIPEGTLVETCTCALDAACGCRKPAPGMLTRILASTGIAAGDALYVGDLDIDREAARAAGVPFAWAWDFFGFPPP